MKLFKLVRDNIFLILTLFLLVFIPLYPKLPLINVRNTWVYVRLDDFAVAGTLLIFLFALLTKKVRLKTPLTFPIMFFWLIGAFSTLHGVLILFPMLSNVFSNVALFSLLRRIEYMSLFFVAYIAFKDKEYLKYAIWVLLGTLLAVIGYGFGQKMFGFPAFLTMNEQYAKGIPITLSALSRIPSTFAGQYDLAAYLVLVIPVIISAVFAFKNLLARFLFLAAAALGFGLLFTTVSRVSFFAILVSLVLLLIMQRKKWIIISLLVVAAAFLVFSPSLLKRFTGTVTPVNVLVDSKTGVALGQVEEVDKTHFQNEIILTSPTTKINVATSPAVLKYQDIPQKDEILLKPNVSTGENLPQGTAYINLPLSPVLATADMYFVETPKANNATTPTIAYSYQGKYLVKRAKAYDLSFTTRFQGEWPNTTVAFKRNIFLGSGYGSVSLAVDNDYLRLLGESGIVGFIAFLSVFIAAGIYIVRSFPKLESKLARSFVLGFVAGTFGLAINGALIDVFEASKVAFTYWLLMGITLGTLHVYAKGESFSLYREFKKIVTSRAAVVAYIFVLAASAFFACYNYYFVGDDFTWLHWAVQGNGFKDVLNYFTNTNGFFYRPGAMTYFYIMFKAFWLNQIFYHTVSIFLNFLAAALLFITLFKISRQYLLSVISAILFLVLSGHHEAIFWISATGFLFNAVFILLALLSFVYWREKGKNIYLVFSLIFIMLSLFFHEVGVVAPFLLISYDLIFNDSFKLKKLLNKTYALLLSPLVPYFALRLYAHSHWFNGDYSYNLVKLPFNFVGNAVGYFILDLIGPQALSFYEKIRNFSKDNIIISIPLIIIVVGVCYLIYKKYYVKVESNERKIVALGLSFFIISLIPFLGLGNITSRYSYLSSMGFVIFLSFFALKIYSYLFEILDRYIAVMGMIIVSIIFLSIQLFQLQTVHSDWFLAGRISTSTITSFQNVYDPRFAKGEVHFYFVDVPVQTGQAWVFPVGLKDALWFCLKDKNFTVDTTADLKTAVDIAKDVNNSQIFVLNKNGIITKYIPDVPDYIAHPNRYEKI